MFYCFIINNGPGKTANAPAILDDIRNLENPISYRIYKTTAIRTATEFVADYCRNNPQEETCFVACGGDGTICEVSTGMMRGGTTNKYLAVLAYGSGNDFIKYYPGKNFRSIADLVNGTAHLIDIMRVNGDSYSINVCNFGFDSAVCSVANKLNRHGWKNIYRWGLLYAILFAKRNSIDVKADGKAINKGRKLFLCTLGNNDHLGAEYYCSPYASNDDGLIELGLVKTLPFIKFLFVRGYYIKGTHLDTPWVAKHFIYQRCKTVDVHFHKYSEICLDGEMLPGQDFHIEIVPGAINFIIPA